MRTDTVAYHRARTGLNSAGALNGVRLASEKLALAVGTLIIGLVLSASGYVQTGTGISQSQPASALVGIPIGYVVLPIIYQPSSLILLRLYKLPEDKTWSYFTSPVSDIMTASGRVVVNCAQAIIIITINGTAKIMPVMPQMAPHTESDSIMNTGLRFSELPIMRGSRKFSTRLWAPQRKARMIAEVGKDPNCSRASTVGNNMPSGEPI